MAKAKVIIHGRNIIKAVSIRNTLNVGTGLQQLFNSPVEIADYWLYFDNALTVKLKLDPKNTVGTWMLGTHVESICFCLQHVTPPLPDDAL